MDSPNDEQRQSAVNTVRRAASPGMRHNNLIFLRAVPSLVNILAADPIVEIQYDASWALAIFAEMNHVEEMIKHVCQFFTPFFAIFIHEKHSRVLQSI